MEILNELHFTNNWIEFLLPVLMIVLDVATGFLNAWINKNVSSSIMREGLGHKAAELAYIFLGFLAYVAFGLHSVFLLAVFYVCLMELVSIIENCAKLGVPIPPKLKEFFEIKSKEGE